MASKTIEKRESRGALENASFLVWRIERGKERLHEQEVRRAYNNRDRLRPEQPETKH